MSIGIEDISAAAKRIADHAVTTPLIRNEFLDERLGATIIIKPESLQRSGSFKFRGAFNRLSQLSADERKNGVVAFSSGNHAQGIALAARLLNIPATIVMPKDAPAIKRQRTEAYGATIRPYDRYRESREDIASDMARNSGAVLVPSFDDPHIIAGQGTCGLELTAQTEQIRLNLDLVLAPCGGGGLIAGTSTAVKSALPNAEIYSVEPEDFDDHLRSFQSGQRESIEPGGSSICDALLAPSPGELTWAINRNTLTGGLRVSDNEVAHAVSFAYQYLKLVIEPGGAVALAAILHHKLELKGKTVAVIASGGNIDPGCFIDCLNKHPNP